MTIAKGPRRVRGPRLLTIASAAVSCVCVLLAGQAAAHAERVGSQPQPGTRAQDAPSSLTIEFSEPPTGDAVLEVLDGCGNDVVGELQVQNMEISADLSEGQPGRWEVASTVVSGVDGHQTKDSWSFTVAGSKDCSVAAPADEEGVSDGEDDDSSSFPLVPVALGGLAVLGVALALRALTGRSED